MTAPGKPPVNAESDAGLARVLEQYLAALEAGNAPDREAFLAAHPHLASELRECLASLDLLRVAAHGPLALDEGLAAGSDQPVGRLGDFAIVREVGRGGMGVVYEAEQLSLGRRVALKILPFAAMMDPRQLRRFQNEARASASLEHPHIVPVYGVGCERGIHYYAMRFIDGQSLDALLRHLRRPDAPALPQSPPPSTDPTTAEPAASILAAATVEGRAESTEPAPLDSVHFRRVAEWGVQAAEALEHAHSVGVLHRDIKPANLMLDGQGKLWVTDFGLARTGADGGLTLTGDLLGTLRYMSPEQALAKHGLVDGRTDVYALGVTLYELLTLRPAFGGIDRQELLRQIAFEEPVPPRRLDRDIPADLETIVLKAIDKSPAERYATAAELADDLQRFLDDKPIRARQPSLVQRLRKWGRRHRPVVWATTVVLLVAGLLAGASGLWWMQKRAQVEWEAEQTLQEAAGFQEQGKWPEALAAARRAEAVLTAGPASEGLRQRVARVRFDLEMVARLQEIRLLKVRDASYAKAFREYGIDVTALGPQEVETRIRETSIPVELAAALDDWAMECRTPRKKSDRTWEDLLAVARAVDPDEWRNTVRSALERRDQKALKELTSSRQALALPPSTQFLLGTALWESGAVEQAEALLRSARNRHRGDFQINHRLGKVLRERKFPRLEEAVRFFTASVALHPESAGALNDLGVALSQKGALDEAIKTFKEALSLNPDLADAHNNLGLTLMHKGKLDEAINAYKQAIRLQPDSAGAYCNLGITLARKNAWEKAVRAFKEAIRLEPEDPEIHVNLGNVLADKGDLDRAIRSYQEAVRLQPERAEFHKSLGTGFSKKRAFDQAVAAYKEAVRREKDDPGAHYNLGIALKNLGRWQEAIGEFRLTISLQKNFPRAYLDLGDALRQKGQVDEAIQAYQEAIWLKPDYTEAYNRLGIALLVKGRQDEALAAFQAAIRIKPGHAHLHLNLGLVLQGKGRLGEAIAEFRKALQLNPKDANTRNCLRRAEQFARLDPKLPDILSGKTQPTDPAELIQYAELCQEEYKQLYASAARLYQQALASQSSLADDLRAGHRYNAACSAARAASGQGAEAARLGPAERARWRRQALDWLRADLALWNKQADSPTPEARALVQEKLRHWQVDRDLTGVRAPEALAKLPQAEREAWQTLWQDVAATLVRVRRPVPTKPPSPGQPP